MFFTFHKRCSNHTWVEDGGRFSMGILGKGSSRSCVLLMKEGISCWSLWPQLLCESQHWWVGGIDWGVPVSPALVCHSWLSNCGITVCLLSPSGTEYHSLPVKFSSSPLGEDVSGSKSPATPLCALSTDNRFFLSSQAEIWTIGLIYQLDQTYAMLVQQHGDYPQGAWHLPALASGAPEVGAASCRGWDGMICLDQPLLLVSEGHLSLPALLRPYWLSFSPAASPSWMSIPSSSCQILLPVPTTFFLSGCLPGWSVGCRDRLRKLDLLSLKNESGSNFYLCKE